MDSKDITILRILDGLWETYEWVPLSEIKERGPPMPYEKKLRNLKKLDLVLLTTKDEMHVKITEKGQDTLAVWDFKRHGVIDEIGHVVGEGKEAVVVLAKKGDDFVALKFNRYYSAEFQKIKESLSYSAIKWWKQRLGRKNRPLDISRAKAQIEYYALSKLEKKVNVPKPLGINRHVVAMEFLGDQVPAPLLHQVGKGSGLKDEIIENYEAALKLGIVHGDLSPYNIIVYDKPYLIDWPQAVPKGFEGAKELMERDKKKIDDFF
ncbi:MAG: hypothetical protein GOU98_03505 [Candidatus Altiarchaeota archaeon]|nr:hypothetical protein [Candidatus Altiarchaeota archaeon]